MSKQEVLNVFQKLLKFGGEILYYTNDEKICLDSGGYPCLELSDVNCIQLLELSVPFERPDAYYLSSNGVLFLIEHFEVDITKKNENGSSPCKKDYSLLNKKIDEEFAKNTDVYINNRINIKGTVDDFVNSIKYSIDKHYKNIVEYKKNILNKLVGKTIKEIKIIFLMENPMGFGAYYIGDRKLNNILPFEYSNFIDILKDKIDVDYFMYFSKTVKDGSALLSVISRELLEIRESECLNLLLELDCGHNNIAIRDIISEKEILDYINNGGENK